MSLNDERKEFHTILGDRGAQCDYVSQRSEPNDLLIKLMNDNPMKELTKSFGILSIEI